MEFVLKITGLGHGIEQAKLSPKNNSDQSFDQILKKAQNEEDKQKLKEVCRQLESVFVHQMISQMRSSIPKSGFLGQSNGEKLFQDMLDEKYAAKISKAGGIGLADMLYRQLSEQVHQKDMNKK